ncbi:MAG: helix-turn-helix transcriptional regulator [Sulfurimonas sp.]|nr:MAG: helix-turn-helix transcriptional regulator [Sulfurimonas sp.]
MKNIILFTKMSSIQKHWINALEDTYKCIVYCELKELTTILKIDKLPIIVMFDEMSVCDIKEVLSELNSYEHAKVLLFNSIPEVHHAASLLGGNVKGYENSYLDRLNLLHMIESIENGKSWLFLELNNFIISKYLEKNKKNRPAFFETLTQKEKEIALMISEGLTNKEIVAATKVALSTVKGHVSKIFLKASVTNRMALALVLK